MSQFTGGCSDPRCQGACIHCGAGEDEACTDECIGMKVDQLETINAALTAERDALRSAVSDRDARLAAAHEFIRHTGWRVAPPSLSEAARAEFDAAVLEGTEK